MKPALTLLAALLLVPLGATHAAELRLPSILADHMVLQCDQPVPVWGWGDAGEQVTVEFAGQNKSATADAYFATTTVVPGRLAWTEEKTSRVFSPVAGRVVSLLAAPGAAVKRGQALALISSPDIGQAQSEVRRAETDLALARILAVEILPGEQNAHQEDGRVDAR